MPAPNNQTISYLSRRLSETGVDLRKRLGQNFLVDQNLVRLIATRAELTPDDVVLEVGTGTGSLTALVAPQVAAVVTVEIDARLFQLASEELGGCTNVVMLQQDALRNKSHFEPGVIEAVGEQLAVDSRRRLKLVANLPYSVATPVIANLLSSPIVPTTMTVTIQKELADRIAAKPCTKDYGALSVWIQSQCRVELVRTLPPSVFWPQPKVNSAIVHITVDEALRQRIADLDFFHSFVRSLFLHRRKFLRGVLLGSWKATLGKEGVDQVLDRVGLDPKCRAEQLEVEAILRLCDATAQALKHLTAQD